MFNTYYLPRIYAIDKKSQNQPDIDNQPNSETFVSRKCHYNVTIIYEWVQN